MHSLISKMVKYFKIYLLCVTIINIEKRIHKRHSENHHYKCKLYFPANKIIYKRLYILLSTHIGYIQTYKMTFCFYG